MCLDVFFYLILHPPEIGKKECFRLLECLSPFGTMEIDE